MSIQKECIVCSKIFVTRTNLSTWQTKCADCYAERKNTTVSNKLSSRIDNLIMGVEDRVKAIEDKFSNVEMVIEITAKESLSPLMEEYEQQLNSVIESALASAKEDMSVHIKLELDKFQSQLATMHGRIRYLDGIVEELTGDE